MAVRRRHVGPGGNLHLEQSQPARLRAVDQIANLQLSDLDGLLTPDDLLGKGEIAIY
jgi:hypothetical protein